MGEKLLDRMRRIIRTRHYSFRTEKSYLGWVRGLQELQVKKIPGCALRAYPGYGNQKIQRY